MSASHIIADLSVNLADRAESFCRHYFPEGRKQGNYWQIGDTSGAKGQSLAIRLHAQGGRKAGSPPPAPARSGRPRHGDAL